MSISAPELSKEACETLSPKPSPPQLLENGK